MYKIYGDYGYRTECLLHETESLPAAERWVDRYTQSGDMGGYNIIEVARFDARDEYVVEYICISSATITPARSLQSPPVTWMH